MFQKEVANRIIATQNNKSYGKLSVVVQSRYKVKKLLDVPSKLFTPPPKVDGTILEFTPHNNYKNIDIDKTIPLNTPSQILPSFSFPPLKL